MNYKKILLNFSLIIFLNIIFFIGIGYLLGYIFGNMKLFLIGSLIFSIIPLIIILLIQIKKIGKEFNNLNKIKKNEPNQ